MRKAVCILIALIMIIHAAALGETAAQDVMNRLSEGNGCYLQADDEKVSQNQRQDTAANGQHPYAIVITCSDSRVPAELIFNAGIGELFVIRTAGNVIGNFELGSVEYGAEHLHAPLVLVLGHTHCGAVAAALEGEAHGYIADIVDEICCCLPEGCDAAQAEILNVENSIARIRESKIMQELEDAGEVTIAGAVYDIETGKVTFL